MTQHKRQALALAAALATLGLSVGVEIQSVLAASPEAPIGSNQFKVGHEGIKKDAIQMKENAIQQKLDATQHKLPSMQQKDRMMPGVKPVDPPR
ncbi:MAG: hypothetical protein Q7U76_10255 [Nitrospirota bacterium]|nr:hypothetical protein [Nitrospirota bacterium]